jgi:hypothetical protein
MQPNASQRATIVAVSWAQGHLVDVTPCCVYMIMVEEAIRVVVHDCCSQQVIRFRSGFNACVTYVCVCVLEQ